MLVLMLSLSALVNAQDDLGMPIHPTSADINTQEIVVLFGFNEMALNLVAEQKIKDVFEGIDQSVKIKLYGHTDDAGSAEVNEYIGMERALNVKSNLVSLGFDANQIFVTSLGESKPVASNKTSEGRAANRRVEIVLQ